MTETILVTGGTGYVAGWCIVAALEAGYRVRTTVRSLAKVDALRAAIATVVEPRDQLEFAVADLMDDAGWDVAMAGVDRVLHVASPLGHEGVTDPEELIAPARDGALRVLRMAAAAGAKRVVMTSAANAASPMSYEEEGVTDETLWTVDDDSLPAYRRSKTIAEREAWAWVDAHPGAIELTTVLPGAVLGPILSAGTVGSAGIVARMLNGGMRRAPRIALEVVDVRDLAELHVLAASAPAAAGHRFLGTGEFVWMSEIGRDLRAGLGPAAAKAPVKHLPDFLVRLAARRDPALASIAISLGRRNKHTIEKARRVLGWNPRPAAVTVVDCARSLIAHGVVKAAA
jgi:nucleoside-diphosphate-sugar epimerase